MKKLSIIFTILSIIALILSIISPWLQVVIYRADNPAIVELNLIYRPLVFWDVPTLLGLPMIILIIISFSLNIMGLRKDETKYVFYSSMLVLVLIMFFIGYATTVVPNLVNSELVRLKSASGFDYKATIEILGGTIIAVFSSILGALVAIIENI